MMKGVGITNIEQGMMNVEGGRITNIKQARLSTILIIYDEGQGRLND